MVPLQRQFRSNGEQDLYDEHEERARRTETLQRAESEFDPIRASPGDQRMAGNPGVGMGDGRVAPIRSV